jgi:hypothetical protein
VNALQWAGAFQRLSTVRGVSKLSTILPHMMKKWGLPLRKLIVSFIIVGSLQFAALSPQAQAQSDSRHAATVVDLEIAPAELDKFLAALKENGAATIKESGCLQYNILQSPPIPIRFSSTNSIKTTLPCRRTGPRTISRNTWPPRRTWC